MQLREHCLKLKPRKCHLFQIEVPFLGRVVTHEGMKVNPENVKVVLDWPVLKLAKEVLSFLGLVNYHREYIPDYSAIAAPLYALVKKGVPFDWTEKHQKCFKDLKQALATAPVLAYPKKDGIFILDTDASNTAIGAELLQVQDGEE